MLLSAVLLLFVDGLIASQINGCDISRTSYCFSTIARVLFSFVSAKQRLSFVQYRRCSPHSPLPAVPFPRWGTLNGICKLIRFSANIVHCYNFVWAVRNILLKSSCELHCECKLIIIKIFQFDMQNYNAKSSSLNSLRLLPNHQRSPAGKGDRGER